MTELRAVIEAGGPGDQVEGRRVALRAIPLVPDDAQAEEMYQRLVIELSLLAVIYQMGDDTTYARKGCHAVADEIERASRRH